jgi:GrpB-like predicted nucleotidyltransferase (UPF0157 family)
MITIVPYKESWMAGFHRIGSDIKIGLGDLALAIHHIGSTSVPGLSAKDVIDIQVTVASLDRRIADRLLEIGFYRLEDISADHRPPGRADLSESDLQKQFYQRQSPNVNLHVRITGTYNQRYPLLCRDYLRQHGDAAKAYELVKINLAKRFPNNLDAYYEIKDPVFDIIMAGAEAWANRTNWSIPQSDIN